jgi:P27 family predicted phage terminase small subunit
LEQIMAGRPPLSEEDAWLRGTKSQSRKNYSSVFVGGRPKKPKDLSPNASDEWDRIVRQLVARGTATRLDASALETYCRHFATWRGLMVEAEEHPMIDEIILDKNGDAHTRRIVNPALKQATQIGNLLARFQREFSATPASREAAKPAAPPAPKRDEIVPGSVPDLLRQNAEEDEAAQVEEDEHTTVEPYTPVALPHIGRTDAEEAAAQGETNAHTE